MNEEDINSIKRRIAFAVSTVEDIDKLIKIIHQTTFEEWEQIKIENTPKPFTAKKPKPITTVCQLCSFTHETDRGYHDDVCDKCYHKHIIQVRRIDQHRTRAKKAGLPNTLRISEWILTLQHFNGICAYCQEEPYQVLEHFLPIELGGPTTAWNCVPSCTSCNHKKKRNHPDKIRLIPQKDIQRVQRYLDALRP